MAIGIHHLLHQTPIHDFRYSRPILATQGTHISPLCAQLITHLFTCPEYPPSSSNSQVKLPHFIAYALSSLRIFLLVQIFGSLFSHVRRLTYLPTLNRFTAINREPAFWVCTLHYYYTASY